MFVDTHSRPTALSDSCYQEVAQAAVDGKILIIQPNTTYA
jgi:hypothetical protein